MTLTNSIIKTGIETITATLFPPYYFAYKTGCFESDVFVVGSVVSMFLSGVLSGGIVGIDALIKSLEEYTLGSQNIKIETEQISYSLFKKYEDNDDAGKMLLNVGIGLVCPAYYLIEALTSETVTEINETYKVQGDDIIQFSKENGYFINDIAFNERDFYIRDTKYNQKELEDELENLVDNFENFQNELADKSASGKYTQAGKQNTEYVTRLRDLEKELDVVYEAKRKVLYSLQESAKKMNEEAYALRNEAERKKEELKQKRGGN